MFILHANANADAVVLGPPEQTEKNGDDCEAKTEPPVGTGTAHWVGLSRLVFVFHTAVTV